MSQAIVTLRNGGGEPLTVGGNSVLVGGLTGDRYWGATGALLTVSTGDRRPMDRGIEEIVALVSDFR